MYIWLINSSEPTPLDEGEIRLLRMGILSKYLLQQGHEVLWWNADFCHPTKKHRFGEDRTIEIEPNYRIRFLHAPGYDKHISLARFWDHRIYAQKFAVQARKETPPDVILCSLPTLDLAAASVRYGKEFNVPVVVDIRDLWPDVIADRIPRLLKWSAPLILAPYYAMAKSACKNATALTGNAPDFVEWGLRKARRSACQQDQDFPFGYEEPAMSEDDKRDADTFWLSKGINLRKHPSIICFFGTLGHQFRFDEALKAAEKVLNQKDALFVCCGNGERLDEFREHYSHQRRIVFPGWVNAKQIWQLMRHSSIALAPYNINDNFRHNLANKLIEYMAGGLPILFSIDEGYVANLIRENEIGLTYSGSADRLAATIIRLLDDEPYRQRMAENSRKLFERKYKAETVYNGFVTYLETIANQK